LGFHVAQAEFFLMAVIDSGDGSGDFAGGEFEAAAGAFVVEADAGTGVEVVALAVVDRYPVAVDFGNAVGAARVEGGFFGLGDLADFAEHFAGAGLIKANAGVYKADGVEEAGNTEGGYIAG
jgi:hypothetical protein